MTVLACFVKYWRFVFLSFVGQSTPEKSEAGVGARVLRFLRHKMPVIQRHSASNIKGRSVILKIGYISGVQKGCF